MKRPAKRAVEATVTVEKPDPRVSAVRVKSRTLYIYRDGANVGLSLVKDAIVWVKPVESSTPETIASVVALMKKHGAACVIALPFESKNAAVPAKVVAGEANEDRSAREVVEELLSNVREQQDEVRRIVNQAMDEVGL